MHFPPSHQPQCGTNRCNMKYNIPSFCNDQYPHLLTLSITHRKLAITFPSSDWKLVTATATVTSSQHGSKSPLPHLQRSWPFRCLLAFFFAMGGECIDFIEF